MNTAVPRAQLDPAGSVEDVFCRVLIVIPGLAGNGVSRNVLDLASALKPLGVDVEVLTIRPLELEEIPHDEGASIARSVRLTSGGLPLGRRQRYKVVGLASRLLRSARRADVVVSGWDFGGPLIAAYLAGRTTGKPVFTMVGADTVRAMEQFAPGWASKATKWVYPRLDGAVCHAEGQAQIIARVGLPPDRARVIPHGINVQRVRALAGEDPPAWLPLDQPYVVSAGRLSAEKRYDALIAAHAQVLAEGLPHRLVILGDGEERSALEALSAQLGVRDSVLLPGFFHNPFPVVAHASLFCLTSKYEGWSLVLTEALALGIPAIATDTVGGPSQILGDGAYGELLDDFSVAALAESITRHLRDPGILEAKADAGREHAASFSAQARAERYAGVFREVLAR